ncbi:unnamed protein product, partial [Choristocarpus tenellus]
MSPQISKFLDQGKGTSTLLSKVLCFGCSPAQKRAWGVYCEGPLLEAVQMSGIFPECKTFVDMPMKRDPEEILRAFAALGEMEKEDPVKLSKFIHENFNEAGSDMTPCFPPDYDPEPAFLEIISDPKERAWAKGMHSLWPNLVRRVEADVIVHPQRYSLLSRHHPVVVPGGRFRESYYWDTFWTVRGLLVSGMVETARGAVLNLLDDVDQFGFVPNGGRLYYTERSQPPLLSDMVCDVYTACPDITFLSRALPTLELEYAFWMDQNLGRAVEIPCVSPHSSLRSPAPSPIVVLNRYWGGPSLTSRGMALRPRPEAFREDAVTYMDTHVAYHDDQVNEKNAEVGACGSGLGDRNAWKVGVLGCCQELAAAAESGWDFSSRWLGPAAGASEGSVAGDNIEEGEGEGVKTSFRQKAFFLGDLRTTGIVPAELNSFLHRVELNMARLHHALGGMR